MLIKMAWRLWYWVCDRKAKKWFTAVHPHWDNKLGKPKEWSLKKYGPRPQVLFYERWERRRNFAANKLGLEYKSYECAERELVRKQYGIDR